MQLRSRRCLPSVVVQLVTWKGMASLGAPQVHANNVPYGWARELSTDLERSSVDSHLVDAHLVGQCLPVSATPCI